MVFLWYIYKWAIYTMAKSPNFIPFDPGIPGISDPEVALWAVLARGGAYTSRTQMVSVMGKTLNNFICAIFKEYYINILEYCIHISEYYINILEPNC